MKEKGKIHDFITIITIISEELNLTSLSKNDLQNLCYVP